MILKGNFLQKIMPGAELKNKKTRPILTCQIQLKKKYANLKIYLAAKMPCKLKAGIQLTIYKLKSLTM